MTSQALSQWDCIRKNLGQWQGSFTQLSRQGEPLRDTPSHLALEEADADTIQLTLTRTPPGEAPSEMVRSFRRPGPGPIVPFFETGAFCQGSTYWSHLSQSGVELALTSGDRRLRLVLLYGGDSSGRSQLSEITLIRESRVGSGAIASPPLTVDQLLGTWQGQSTTLFPTGRQSDSQPSMLTLQQEGNVLHQQLEFSDPSGELDGAPAGRRTLTSHGRMESGAIVFEAGPQPVQVLPLPGGGSATFPPEIQAQQPFFLELGWLLDASHRQRLIRRYDALGNWESVTLVQEEKVS